MIERNDKEMAMRKYTVFMNSNAQKAQIFTWLNKKKAKTLRANASFFCGIKHDGVKKDSHVVSQSQSPCSSSWSCIHFYTWAFKQTNICNSISSAKQSRALA